MKNFGEKNEKKEGAKENTDTLASMISMAMDRPEMRTVAVYGDITEDRCAEAVYGLLTLDLTSRSFVTEKQGQEDEQVMEVVEPIEFYISSYGGQATEMFAVYDVMRDIRERTPIFTENEFTEVKSTQKMYIEALAGETDMTHKYIKRLMDKKTNVYLDAEEAVNLGIADIIV